MRWFRQNWFYLLSFILGGVGAYSDYLLIIIAFGGWVIVLICLIVFLFYWIPRCYEFIRFRKCNHTVFLKRMTICFLLFLFIAPISTVFITSNILKFYGNNLIEKIEKFKDEESLYPTDLSSVKPLLLANRVYRYSSDNDEGTFYLSYKSRGMVRKYYDYSSREWFEAAR